MQAVKAGLAFPHCAIQLGLETVGVIEIETHTK
jgi:hypothetical protein